MKVLITGENGYIGSHIGEWIAEKEPDWEVERLSVRDDAWKDKDFSSIDVIIHTAGIVHHPEIKDWFVYNKVNTVLTQDIAVKAKKDGVKQFVFFSTMAVYGKEKKLQPNKITLEDKPNPSSMYGKSKLLAEQKLQELESEGFRISIVRPPNVYGKACPGGYIAGFTKIVRLLPAIPFAYENVKQSMIYIDNVCELARLLIVDRIGGIFEPQDDHAVSAVELMTGISNGLGLTRPKSKVLGFAVRLLSWLSIVRKAYGGIEYDDDLSKINGSSYVVVPFTKGIQSTVAKL